MGQELGLGKHPKYFTESELEKIQRKFDLRNAAIRSLIYDALFLPERQYKVALKQIVDKVKDLRQFVIETAKRKKGIR